MKILDNFRRSDGKWGDVVAHGTGYAWLYSVEGAMVCEVNGALLWTRAVPTDFLRFTRAAAVPELACLGQALDNTCFDVTAHAVTPDGIAFGQNPVAFGLDGAPYVVRSSTTYTRWATTVTMPNTSQGIRDVLPDGTVVFGDATYHAVIGGHPFWQYQTRGAITVGQAGTNVGIGVYNSENDDYLVIPRPGDPLGVHQALLADGTLAVCAWTVHGAELWLIDLLAPTDPPDPVEPPVEPPDPPVEPPDPPDPPDPVDPPPPSLRRHRKV